MFFCNNSAWLESWDDEVVATVNRRIGAATGLEMDTAEPLQVSTPVLCERYEPPENCSQDKIRCLISRDIPRNSTKNINFQFL